MALDYKKIKSGLPSQKQIDPRKIFTTLKRDTAKFKRPSDEQGDVFDDWFAKRSRGDNTLKMNTGSGKTVVGLLCLQNSLHEGVGPAVYVTPENYLIRQVVSEAGSLGIAVTENEQDPAFLSGNAILVINIWKLVNCRSVFGVGRGGANIEIGSLVIDDAQACPVTVAEQFKIRLSSLHPAYEPLRSRRRGSRPVACSFWGRKNVFTRPGPEADIGLARAGAASKRLSGPTACQITVLSAPSARDVLPCENVISRRSKAMQCTFPAANRMSRLPTARKHT